MSSRKPKISDTLYAFFEYGIYIPHKLLYMGEEEGVEHAMAEKAIKGLMVLDHFDATKPLNIVMNNIGGDMYHGFAIYDAIKGCKSETVIIATGHVISMGALIFQAADRRIITKNSTMMLHYGALSFEGHSKEFEIYNNENQRLSKKMEKILLMRIKEKKPKFGLKQLKEMITFDKFITAKEAVELGLADEVWE